MNLYAKIYGDHDNSPDTFEYSPGIISIPNKDFVISRNEHGEVVSRYSDLYYNLELYCTTSYAQHKVIDFRLIPKSCIDEAKWLWFLLYAFKRGRNNNTAGVAVLYRAFMYFIKPLCIEASDAKISVSAILEDSKKLASFIHRMPDKEHYRKAASTCLSLYNEIGKELTGFSCDYSSIISNYLNSLIHRTDESQTPVIPPRIYEAFHRVRWSFIEDIEAIQTSLGVLISKISKEPICRSISPAEYRKRRQQFASIVEGLGLTEYLKKYNVGCRKELFVHISLIQRNCKQLIHFYSGMRDDEGASLKASCLIIESVYSRPKVRLIGNTSKYLGSKKQTMWVTSIEIERVVNILNTINKSIASIGLNVGFDNNSINPCSLFLSPLYMFKASFLIKYPNGRLRTFRVSEAFEERGEEFRITKKDIKFLEKIDPSRDWNDPDSEFAIGKMWPFKCHQFRRSLAIYSAQSGLVSIGSLQNQLKHLFKAIAFYYRNGAENAKALFKISSDHIANDYIANKPTADLTAFLLDILSDEEATIGIHGKTLEENGLTEEKIYADRKGTIRKFKKGQLAYTETPVGGCASRDECDKFLTRSFVECPGCISADIKPAKLKRVISAMEIYVSTLDEKSVEYRSENQDLKILKDYAFKEGLSDGSN
jgi:hypothetical protein